MKYGIYKIKDKIKRKLYVFRIWYANFKKHHPHRFYGSQLFIALLVLTIIFRSFITEELLIQMVDVSATTIEENPNRIESVSVESIINSEYNESTKGIYSKSFKDEVRSDVGFADLRVLTLEDFFNHYGSPLADHSDEFIEASERYNVNNWQLLPAIALAETIGCQTGISYEQRNCWGWGGSGKNRWVFPSFEEAIDTITYRMITGYGNNNMNAKDIQSTYCGRTCMQWGWRWARGVNYYTRRINDFGERYGLERTNEINDWS